MITYTLEHLKLFKTLSPNFEIAIEYLLGADFSKIADGRYEVADDDVFAIIKEYETKPAEKCNQESHKQYADIQVVISGKEKFGYAPLFDQQPTTPFLPTNDVCFYTLPAKELSFITLQAGQFIIFLPSDIHQPDMMVDGPEKVRKVVMKVKL